MSVYHTQADKLIHTHLTCMCFDCERKLEHVEGKYSMCPCVNSSRVRKQPTLALFPFSFFVHKSISQLFQPQACNFFNLCHRLVQVQSVCSRARAKKCGAQSLHGQLLMRADGEIFTDPNGVSWLCRCRKCRLAARLISAQEG